MSEHLKIYTDIQWTLYGFILFLTLFVILVATTYLPSQKKIHHHLSQLPLGKDNQEGAS